MPEDDPEGERRLGVEACRLHQRYTAEVVERFNLCPWARRAGLDGQVRRWPLLQSGVDPQPTLDLIASLEGEVPLPQMVIAIYPRLALAPSAFDAFAAVIKARDQARHHGSPVYVSATFHPDYAFDARTASALVPWLRRSPDPSLQLVRLDIIEAARGRSGKMLFDFSPAAWDELRRRVDKGTVFDRVAADNQATVLAHRQEIESALADIAADRARTYAALT